MATGISTVLLSGSWKQQRKCDIRVSDSGVAEHSSLPGRDAASAGKYLPTKSLGLVESEDGGNMSLQNGVTSQMTRIYTFLNPFYVLQRGTKFETNTRRREKLYLYKAETVAVWTANHEV